ncbi:hypothetical protein HD806DRAFT_541229 [Xylariaceae sp. AK1471]|nr:hypothetical protein HD806DRAFT_541229 [Xylariaceae sp. AK1471]
MASLQTHVFENDEWVTRTVTADELIGMSTKPSGPRAVEPPPPKPPNYGLLTRTIIESPIIRWVLPVQLRSSRFNDVALVGDQSVQICELGTDMQLQPVAKKVDFGSRIRNCRVMGTHDYLRKRREDIHANYYQSGDIDMTDSDAPTATSHPSDNELFQQILLLVLSTGEVVFLFMNPTPAGDWKFVSSHFSILSGRLVDPGFHMAISPDGGYLALACSENLFIVYQLESIEELRRQHHEGQSIRPIRSIQARAVKGIVHKIDFLHPGSENVSQIILLVVTVQLGVPKLAIYEWDSSESLQHALSAEKSGHRLDETAGLPLLIIPLTVCCQFLVITEHSMAICSDVLSGPPVFVPFELAHRDDTSWHHGTHTPMWTAWTRPMREESYHADTDLIYLAREDGWVNCLEIKGDSGIESSIYMGPLDCNIDSAFASLSIPHGEVLVAGGDYGPGAVWCVQARQNPQRIGPLPNWSPTVDLVLKKDGGKNSKSEHRRLSKRPSLTEKARTRSLAPARLFACSSRDASGAIVELRYGIQAKIGLDLLYNSPIRRCWAIPSFDDTPEASFFMLLALPENSALLQVSHDLAEVSEKGQNTVDFDLLSTTLAVHTSKDIVIQITTTHATIMSPTSCYQHSISDMIEDPSASVADAALTDETLALSVYSHSVFKIKVFIFDKTRFVLQQVFEVDGEVTALSLKRLSGSISVLAGLWQNNQSTLAIFPINSPQSEMQTSTSSPRVPLEIKLGESQDADNTTLRAVASIICLNDEKIVVGMKNGEVLTVNYQSGREFRETETNYFGISPSQVFPGMGFDTGPSTIVCNDAGLAIMKEPNATNNLGCFEEIFQVWLTDASEPSMPSPTINSVASLHQIPDYGDNTMIMIAGSRILITELQPHPAPVPRYMPIGGTPLKILYSERLDALVTVVVKSGIPSLHFFDPITGADLSHPIRKVADLDDGQHVDVDYITYLGKSDIKIVSLLNWRYKHKGNLYEWFVILAKLGEGQGRLLVVSAEPEAAVTDMGTSRRIRFWTQFYRKIKDGPPRAGATDDDGLFLNFGKTIEYHTIEEKKFKTAMKYDLPSPATSLEVVDGQLHVLTTHHSLIILDYTSETALESQRMVQLHTDEIARNGLHAIDVASVVGIGERQRFSLLSDPMCGVYGLWSSSPTFDTSSFQLVFRADLTVSIRKFVRGHTRPPWTRDLPRYGSFQSRLERHDILGLAMNGSLTQFSILHEDVWRLLRYIQNLAMMSTETCLIPRYYRDIDEPDELDPKYVVKTKMHVDGDILQRCLEQNALERIVLRREELERLQELLTELGLDLNAQAPSDASLASFEYAYGILEYYLSPAI